MKKQLFILALSLLTLGFISCEKQSAGHTGKVDYVKLQLKGDAQILLGLGDTFEEPGWTATDKGVDVHDKVDVVIIDMTGEVVEEITTASPGIFTITYSATSQDNMYIEVQRQVLVFDPNLELSIDGAFAVDFAQSARLGDGREWTWQQWSDYYTSDAWAYAAYSLTKIDINFSELVPGIYEVDDLLGGFYTGLRGYGPYMKEANGASYYNYYSMGGMVILNADGTIDLVSSHVEAWGDALVALSATFDPKTNTIDMHSFYGDDPVMDFHAIMVKK